MTPALRCATSTSSTTSACTSSSSAATSPASGTCIPRRAPTAPASHGDPVTVEPYLGARGHLVALREGDGAYLHVHPLDEDASGRGPVRFATSFPTAGRYRLFLQRSTGASAPPRSRRPSAPESTVCLTNEPPARRQRAARRCPARARSISSPGAASRPLRSGTDRARRGCSGVLYSQSALARLNSLPRD